MTKINLIVWEQKIDKISTTGYVIMFRRSVVGLRLKRQTSTAKSSTKAEILAISMTLGDYKIIERTVDNIFGNSIKNLRKPTY
jgi:hypothetical protein